jgi:tetratricopeptide (TPR) repeat protein
MQKERYIRFDRYLNNELPEEELKSFEEQLKSDIDFKEDFKVYCALESSFVSKFENREEVLALRKTLSDLGSQHIKQGENNKKETKVISLFRYRNLMVAASIALLIGFFLFNNGSPVYGDFAQHNPLELVVRGDNNEAISKAEAAFNSKNYGEALKQLTILSNNYPNDSEISLYLGISQLELNNYAEAETIFNYISDGNSALATKAVWYKALTFLKQKKLNECKEVLKTIPKSAEEYPQAKRLLKKLS